MDKPIKLPPLPEGWETELLDWVSSCQSAYHIDNTPGHRFGNLGSLLGENRQGLVEYVVELLENSARAAIKADRKTTEKQLSAYRGLVSSMEMRLAHLQEQHDELKKSANPDLLASERAANAMLTEELEAIRQARGEPVYLVHQCLEKNRWQITTKERFLYLKEKYANSKNWETMTLYTAPQPQQIPEGYKLVPVEPTDEMLVAGYLVPLNKAARHYAVYKAMLEAAPEVREKS